MVLKQKTNPRKGAPNRCYHATPPPPDRIRIRIAFDDHRLVANAGLILPSTLALRLGLPQLVDRRLAGRSSDVMSFSTQALTPISAIKKGLPAIHATSVPATPCPEFHRPSGAPSSPGARRTVAARTRRPPP